MFTFGPMPPASIGMMIRWVQLLKTCKRDSYQRWLLNIMWSVLESETAMLNVLGAEIYFVLKTVFLRHRRKKKVEEKTPTCTSIIRIRKVHRYLLGLPTHFFTSRPAMRCLWLNRNYSSAFSALAGKEQRYWSCAAQAMVPILRFLCSAKLVRHPVIPEIW